MGPTLWRLLAVMTEWVWDRGVRGAVGVVGLRGRLRGGEAPGADLDNVMLDTKLSWENKQTGAVSPLITPSVSDGSLTMHIGAANCTRGPPR